jgi:RNA polymerase sigma factor (sigma-70 family)
VTSTAAATTSERVYGRATDEQLAARVASGDSTAFEELYERYRKPLLGCLRSTLREPEDARDALQITMLNAFRALRESRVPDAVRPWLFTIARNAAMSTTRRRVVHFELDEGDVPVLDGPAEALVERERVDHLLDDLEAMAPRRRRVVLMRAVQGLDYEQIGGELGISSAAARQAAREARVALDQTARGRELACEDVSTALELGDTRNARSRTFLAHLRACASCRRRLPAGSITRSQVAAILAGVLAIRTAVSKAISLPTAAIESIGGASVTAKAVSIAAVAVTAGSGVVAGIHGDTGSAPPAGPPVPRNADAFVPPAVGQAPTVARVAAAPEPRAGEQVPEGRLDGRPPGVGSDAEPQQADAAADPSPEAAEVAAPDDGAEQAAPAEAESLDAQADMPASAAKHNENAGDSSGASGSAPGHDGTPPGQGGTPPGQSGESPGASGSAPGHGGTPPGQGGTPPGQSGSAPGQSGSAPGQAGTPPGQAAIPPVQEEAPPGQEATSAGASAAAPGHADAEGEPHSGNGNANGHQA